MDTITASALAKIILFGEHFVVFGEPAVVLAIDKRVSVQVKLRQDKDIFVQSFELGLSGSFRKEKFNVEKGDPKRAAKELAPVGFVVQKILDRAQSDAGVSVIIRSDIPVAAGLGSSAAVATATAKAVSHLLNVPLSSEDVFNIAYEAERLIHGTPSGIDPAIATYGGVLVFKLGEKFQRLKVKGDIPLVVGDTGILRSTGDLVSMVCREKETCPTIMERIIKAGGQIATQAVNLLRQGELKQVGEFMNINHALLCAVGVSSEPLERLVYAARKAGALGAKLTGAGGGGCMVALAENKKQASIAKAIAKAGGNSFIAKKSNEGVRIEG